MFTDCGTPKTIANRTFEVKSELFTKKIGDEMPTSHPQEVEYRCIEGFAWKPTEPDDPVTVKCNEESGDFEPIELPQCIEGWLVYSGLPRVRPSQFFWKN